MQPEICHINLSRGYRGGERQMELLIRGLQRRGWRQTAVVRRDDVLARRLASAPELRVIERPANAALAAWFQDSSPLVHVHQGRSILVASLHHLLQRTPYIVTRRVDNPVSNTQLNRAVYRRAAGIVAVSEAISAVLNQLDAQLDCTVIPDAIGEFTVDAATAAAIRQRTGKSFLIGHVGELDDDHKGQLQLIAAARILASSAPDIGFILVGSGRDEAVLRAAAEGLNNVFFAGQVDQVGNYFAAFDLFAFPSRREGLGSSILDAYQFKLPVIATRVGGIPEIVTDGHNGALLEVDDISALVGAARRYANDPEACARTGAINHATAQRFTPDAIAARYERVYARALERDAA